MSSNFISFIYALILPVSIEHVSFVSSYQTTRPAEDTESWEKMKDWCLSCTGWKDIWWHVKNNILTKKRGTVLIWITHPQSVWLLILTFWLPTIPTYGTYSHEKTDFKEASWWNRMFLRRWHFYSGLRRIWMYLVITHVVKKYTFDDLIKGLVESALVNPLA